MRDLIYMDNAATSWPKPETAISAMEAFAKSVGANPGRSGHRLSIEAGRILAEARLLLAQLFGVKNSLRVCFTKNATEALNVAILGLLKAGDNVITSAMEHNSVMRPLRAMEKRGVTISVVPCSTSGELDPCEVERRIKNNTRAIYMTHASNVTGTIMPVAKVGRIARNRGLVFCVDAAQTAGALPIDVESMNIDLLAFTGHKALLGPQGTGGLVIREGLETTIEPVLRGGTGSRSESEEHPDFMPDRFEAGTPNALGIAGLKAGVRFILERGAENIRSRERELTARLLDGLSQIGSIRVYGTKDPLKQTAVVSLGISGESPSDIALRLDEEFGIMSRPGLQCAPSAHRTTGTFPEGTLRLSMGYFTKEYEIDHALYALEQISKK